MLYNVCLYTMCCYWSCCYAINLIIHPVVIVLPLYYTIWLEVVINTTSALNSLACKNPINNCHCIEHHTKLYIAGVHKLLIIVIQ